MAAGSSNYNRGEMNVESQSKSFDGFMGLTKYGGAAIALTVIMPTLVFAVGMGWLSALVATIVLGVLIGVALKLKGIWYVSLIGTSVLVAIACVLLSLLAGSGAG
jgi:hypothetical protein